MVRTILVLGLFLLVLVSLGCMGAPSTQPPQTTQAQQTTIEFSAKECVKISDLNSVQKSLGYHVMGRLTNECDKDLDMVAFTITAYDENGKIIEVTNDRYPCHDGKYGLDAGNNCTFKSAPIKGMKSYDIEISDARYRVSR